MSSNKMMFLTRLVLRVVVVQIVDGTLLELQHSVLTTPLVM